jgi:hypothetical protein
VTTTLDHTLRPGESLWLLSHKKYAVPTWLIRRYNPTSTSASSCPARCW